MCVFCHTADVIAEKPDESDANYDATSARAVEPATAAAERVEEAPAAADVNVADQAPAAAEQTPAAAGQTPAAAADEQTTADLNANQNQ